MLEEANRQCFSFAACNSALGNHVLRAHPTDYSLFCQQISECRLLANENTDSDYNV